MPTDKDTDSVSGATTGTSWINRLSKEELQRDAERCGLDSKGTVDELTLRLRTFYKDRGEATGTIPKINISKEAEPDTLTQEISLIRNQLQDLTMTKQMRQSDLLNQVRRWNTHFDKKHSDAVDFIERIDELSLAYEVDKQDLLKALPELLGDHALLWYRNNNRHWDSWTDFNKDFKKAFYPREYLLQLEEQIRNRKQRKNEPVDRYITDIQTLIRREGSFSRNQELDRIYKNMLPEYKLYARRRDFEDLSGLQELAQEYETLEDERTRENKNFHGNWRRTDPTEYDAKRTCFRCKMTGHFRRNCKNPWKKFCSRCGKEGVYSSDCCSRRQGNE
ncbi:uncharacterized protein LOC126888115 [Diabrotica virgifera virgifera]|uniref:CCHC-type domain-containing protein n=1 Tax=Diabrotica virgifera virgifera TaxID=50390 RepID=A0ABM5KPG8_DIAVI|nr:uncharacterized protein LOC126888115 [Diabrotica virgifera virgifera]